MNQLGKFVPHFGIRLAPNKLGGAIAVLSNQSHLLTGKSMSTGPEKKVPVFTTFYKPTSPHSIYSLEEAIAPAVSDSMLNTSTYATLSLDHRDAKYSERGVDNLDTIIYEFPEITDFMLMGSGLMGSAVAYYLKKTFTRCADVCVIDKDPYSPHNVTSQCSGLMSFQSKFQDHVRMSTLSKELLRNLMLDPVVTKEDIEKLNLRICSHLILWPQSEVDEVMAANQMQIGDGCHVDIKLPRELETHFPFLKVTGSDVVIGSHSNQDDLIVDPIALRNLYRILAQAYGANFIQAEVLDFNMKYYKAHVGTDPHSASSIVVKLPTGELKHCNFAFNFFSLGHNTPYIEKRALMDESLRETAQDLHFLQPKLRINFSFRSDDTPVLNFPAITDTDGSLLIKESIDGSFRYYLTLEESDTFLLKDHLMFMNIKDGEPCPNLVHRSKLFENYFNDVIKPRLVKRIPSMADAEFNLAFSGFQNVNTHDSSPIITAHPYFAGVALSGGFGSRLMSYAPAAAISIAELLMAGEEETFDITNYYWIRVIKNRKIKEFASLVA